MGVDSGATAPGIYKLEKRQGQWRVVKGPIALEGSSVFYDMETGAESGTIYVATELGLFAIDRSDSVKTLKTFPASRSAIEVHPRNENIIYLAYDHGEVLKSIDRGQTWTVITSEVPTQGFVVLKVDPNSDTIYAEAPGSGIWKRTFND